MFLNSSELGRDNVSLCTESYLLYVTNNYLTKIIKCLYTFIEVYSLIVVFHMIAIPTFCTIKPHQFLHRWPSATLRNQ